MGGLWSKWRKKKLSTIEVLQKLEKDIGILERSKQTNVEKQKRVITSLILYSVLAYIVFALLFYFYYMPALWKYKIMYSAPLLVFPILVWLIKKFLHWYFVKRIQKNELALEDLKETKKKILNEVMETETYKKAKEILEKFALEETDKNDLTSSISQSPCRDIAGQDLRHRHVNSSVVRSDGVVDQHGPPSSNLPDAMPAINRDQPHGASAAMQASSGTAATPQRGGQQGLPHPRRFNPISPPGPPLARPILPRERTMLDRVVEYLVGDGPQNRFALICTECQSHNGMALREEFEYICFRCCYCYAMNPARKHKPRAPPLDYGQQRPELAPSRSSTQPNTAAVGPRPASADQSMTFSASASSDLPHQLTSTTDQVTCNQVSDEPVTSPEETVAEESNSSQAELVADSVADLK